ncbi:MAG: hydrogenase [Proteobacteria bacterium]|nr:hydrogenase [Pseudomonadota bacterium]
MNNATQRKMIAAGAILFLFGLFTGFVVPGFVNPRMGLASHLEGMMNGTFLIALGAAWSYVVLSPRLEKIAFWLILYGTFANWFFITLAAILGTSEMTPIAGKGYNGEIWQEQLITFGLVSVGLTMVFGCAMVVYGLSQRK